MPRSPVTSDVRLRVSQIPTPGSRSDSPAPGIGCALLVFGLVGGAFGVAALVGFSDRVALKFFEIELNDTFGRILWTAGCLAVAGVGGLILRATRRRAEETSKPSP